MKKIVTKNLYLEKDYNSKIYLFLIYQVKENLTEI